jgi:sulfide dehydrogenase cytochrome subunit
MPFPKFLAALAVALSAWKAQAAGNEGAQNLYTQSLAATCANCHGTEGRALPDATVPGLAGVSADTIVEQMKAFRSGERKATIMHQIAKGFTDEQTRQLAEYFASRKR